MPQEDLTTLSGGLLEDRSDEEGLPQHVRALLVFNLTILRAGMPQEDLTTLSGGLLEDRSDEEGLPQHV